LSSIELCSLALNAPFVHPRCFSPPCLRRMHFLAGTIHTWIEMMSRGRAREVQYSKSYCPGMWVIALHSEREAVFNRDIGMRFASAASPTMRQREERDDHIIRSAAERRWRRRLEWLLCNLLDVFVQLVAYILLLMQPGWWVGRRVDGCGLCM
jgi:hypothetical protein